MIQESSSEELSKGISLPEKPSIDNIFVFLELIKQKIANEGQLLPNEIQDLYRVASESFRFRNVAKELVSIVSERTEQINQLYEKIDELKLDRLTGIPNRGLLMTSLAKTLQEAPEHLSVAFIDLTKFKIINDSISYNEGDKVLIELTKLLQEIIVEKHDGFVGRKGGDEFVVYLEGTEEELSNIMSDVSKQWNQIRQNWLPTFREGDSAEKLTQEQQARMAHIQKIMSESGGMIYGITSYQNEDTVNEIIDRAAAEQKQAKSETKETVNAEFIINHINKILVSESQSPLPEEQRTQLQAIFTKPDITQKILERICRYK